jgi:predicted phosphoribosyltransferase
MFSDRVAAAIVLSEILKSTIKTKDRRDTLVLGIPRGGILTASVICRNLSIPRFDIILSRKLTNPNNKEQSIGAVMDDGLTYIDSDIVKRFHITEEYLETEIAFQLSQIIQKKLIYSLHSEGTPLADKIKNYKKILLVDDGISSGATMRLATKWLLRICEDTKNIKMKLILAAPVAPKNIIEDFRNEYAVEIKTVLTPSKLEFHSVEQFHKKFEQITDEQVLKILESRCQ